MGESSITELISVIIPVYNTDKYLTPCLESVCNQTYPKLEIILIDDGSTDGSGELCDEWAKKDSRVKVIHQENAGVSAARNAGMAICTGDLITFVDSDDWMDPEMFAKLRNCLMENRADAAMCGYVDYPQGLPVEMGVEPVKPGGFREAAFQMMRKKGCHTTPWGKLFRREKVFLEAGFVPFDRSIAFGEDGVWLMEVLRNCSVVAFLPQALYYWRPRQESASRSNTVSERKLSFFTAHGKIRPLLPDDPVVKRMENARFYECVFLLMIDAYIAGDIALVEKLLASIRHARWDWICCNEYSLLRKIKFLLVKLEISCHMPRDWVRKTNELNRTTFRR